MTVLTKPRSVPALVPHEYPDRLEVIISLEDIKKGVPGMPQECAVARALARAGYTATVGGHVWLDGQGVYRISSELREWILAFDEGQRVAPERFVLERFREADALRLLGGD
jgi:hypothetical protein